MDGYLIAWRWLAHAAVGGFIVLALGSFAVTLCRQPVRRSRVVVLTLLAAFGVPWIGSLPIAPSGPRVSFWPLPRQGDPHRSTCRRFQRLPRRQLRSSSHEGMSFWRASPAGSPPVSWSVTCGRLPTDDELRNLDVAV